MKIELKNTDFKELVEWLRDSQYIDGAIEGFYELLKPQYEKAFEKYKNEKPKFKSGDKVIFGKNKEEGTIIKVSRLANGKYRYEIEYYYVGDTNDLGEDVWYKTTKYLTDKNIIKK